MMLTKIKQKIYILLSSITTAALLSACGGDQNVNYADASQISLKPMTVQAIEWDEDSANNFKNYKASSGHKAFAVVVTEGVVMSTGASIDKISIEHAEKEALNLCQFANFGDGNCFILDRDSSKINVQLSQAVVESAPEGLTSFRDIKNYYEFVNARAPKAFAVSPVTGTSFWATGEFSLEKVEEYALQACNDLLQDAEPNCTMLYSQ